MADGSAACGLISFLTYQSADSWVAIWTFGLLIATGILARIAYVQIGAARIENRQTQTLLACNNYDLNQVLFECQTKIGDAKRRNCLANEAGRLSLEIKTILNFLDSIAIGIDQKLYVDDLAYSHMHRIVDGQVKELLIPEILQKIDCSLMDFSHLVNLNKRWKTEPPREKLIVPASLGNPAAMAGSRNHE